MFLWTAISSHFAWDNGAVRSPAAVEIFHPEFSFLVCSVRGHLLCDPTSLEKLSPVPEL